MPNLGGVPDDLQLAGRPRWHGQRGRLEVHYLTATDTRTGTGLWVHCEVVAPTTGDAYAHGWAAVFAVDAAPRWERFGPVDVQPRDGDEWFRASGVTMNATSAAGAAGDIGWELGWAAGARPLWTFPRWAWRRQALPAAQVVPVPATTMSGTVDGADFAGRGGVAHIFGHGNAQRWAWLHADLGGGDVLELVAATARRPGLRALPPLPLVQLRVGGRDWPSDSLATSLSSRARIGDGRFRVTAMTPTRRLRVSADLPAERCVEIPYADPDGATATCRNTERADVEVRLDAMTPRGWRRRRTWTLEGTGHAEIGSRP